jgi:ABC-type taurine transport system ATPase subunit
MFPIELTHLFLRSSIQQMFVTIWKHSTFKLKFSKQVVNEALLVKEEIDVD